MAQVDTVVPNSLNYTDIKPQSIENTILLCKYQPTATVTGAQAGDMIKFLISGNGFLDPYSTYFQFTVDVPELAAGEIRFLDRSAHSFFSRIVIKSQGVELERIDNYDVIAAMINDMIYSPEQCTQHYWEGFPTHIYNPQLSSLCKGSSYEHFNTSADTSLLRIRETAVPRLEERDEVLRWLNQGSSPTTMTYIGETAFHNLQTLDSTYHIDGDDARAKAMPVDAPCLMDYSYYTVLRGQYVFPGVAGTHQAGIYVNPTRLGEAGCLLYPVQFAYHQNGIRVPAGRPVQLPAGADPLLTDGEIQIAGTTRMQFICPIYSGVIGLLMPEKKLLPLNLLPLEIEVTFNPYALYSSLSTGSRNYRVTEFNIYGNTLFFEQEIHRTLEASVADHGLFIYCNSFFSALQYTVSPQGVPSSVQISMNLKSINSVHWVFMYSQYVQKKCARKLHFVSHNLTRVQLLNGTQLIPQYPIEGHSGTSKDGQQLQFVIELYKAWNKMHDPARDGALHAYNTCGDQYAGQFDPIYKYQVAGFAGGVEWSASGAPVEGFDLENTQEVAQFAMQVANKQANVGRCQYGISMEGEELGSDRTMITGRKSQYPFQLQFQSTGKTVPVESLMLAFLRADYIIYIRPDLQIVTMGK